MKCLFVIAAVLGAAAPAVGDSTIERIAKPGASGTAAAVRVADAPLVFTRQFSAADTKNDARAQADQALEALAIALRDSGSELTQVVRLNAYVADDGAVAPVEAAIAARFATTPPATTLVRSSLASEGALVAFDAVAVSSREEAGVEILRSGTAIVPEGGKVFVSGQAQKGTDLASSARLTMGELFRTLAHVGLTTGDVVQVKAFIRPFADHVAAAREIAASFEGKPAPPVVLMEWTSDLFTEIELVASAKSLPAPAGDSISFTFLPWIPRSPRYCHVTHVAAGTPLIFVGEVSGLDSDEPRAQMKTIFERLGSTLFEAGTSYRNLAKATYYLADAKAHAVLGDIRGVYFDPARPPAASAIRVGSGLGRVGRAATVDMIAVPVGK
jgi:enamine deaminase RidA (YjgF/YER057c/UK114 family)